MAIVEKVYDLHTLVEGFVLTMEGKALTWFQTLKTTNYSSFMKLAKEFMAEHTKSGLKNDVLSQIYQFTQGFNETIRYCANQLQ